MEFEKLHKKEIENVLKFTVAQKYQYTVKRVVENECLWSLKNSDGWVLAGDDEGNQMIPIWPEAEFAGLCASGFWSDALPARIELEDWLEKWTPGMIREGRMVTVFMTNDHKGPRIHPQQLAEEIQALEVEFYGD